MDLFKAALTESAKKSYNGMKTTLVRPPESKHEIPVYTKTFSTGNFDTSVWKANIVAHSLKGLQYKHAIAQLSTSKKKPATFLLKLFHRVGNVFAKTYDLDPNRLEVVRTMVGKGTGCKDYRLHAKERVGRMVHPRTHVKVEFRYIPDGFPLNETNSVHGTVRKLSDFEKIYDRIRRNWKRPNKMDKKRVLFYKPPWDPLPWKYLVKKCWTKGGKCK